MTEILEPFAGELALGLFKHFRARWINRFKAIHVNKLQGILEAKLARKTEKIEVSVGTCHFANNVFTNLLSSAAIDSSRHPNIQSITVKRIAPDLVQYLIARQMLSSHFEDELSTHLSKLKQLSSRRGITLTELKWEKFPPFHGWLLSDVLFLHPWEVDTHGELTHTSRICYQIHLKHHAEVFQRCRDLFLGH